jgi:hypothetical protein
MLAVEPAGDNGGDEKLGTVAAEGVVSSCKAWTSYKTTYVLGPALAMERRPGLLCFNWKFSSANFSP